MEYYTETEDPFIKGQMASFFASELSPIKSETFEAIEKSFSEGRFTKGQLKEFMVASELLKYFAFYYRPENYGAMHPLYWSMREEASYMPWLVEYVRTHPQAPARPSNPPSLPNPEKPAADVISSPPTPQTTAAPDSSKSESTNRLWMAAALMLVIVLGLIWRLRQRTSRRVRNRTPR